MMRTLGRQPLADPAPGRGADRAPLLLQRRQDRRRRRRDRSRIRRVGGLELRPRAPDPAGLGAARDRAHVRRDRSPLGACDPALRAARGARATDRLVGAAREARLTNTTRGGPLTKPHGSPPEPRSRRWWCRRGARSPAAARSRRAPRRVRPQSLDLALDFYVNPDHAGIYRGARPGLLPPTPGSTSASSSPSDPSAPIKEVAAGRADLAISYEPEVLLAHDQGLPVKAVAAIVPTPLTSLIWLKGSGSAASRTCAARPSPPPGIPYQDAYLKTILARAGLSSGDVNTVDVQQGLLPAILSGRADAMLGGFLQRRGRRPEAARQGPDGDPGRPARDPHLRRAGAGRQLRSTRGRLPRRSSSSSRLFSAARRRPRPIRPAATERDPRRRRRPEPPDHRRRGAKDPPAALDRGQAAIRLHGPASVAPLRPVLRRSGPDQGPARRPETC